MTCVCRYGSDHPSIAPSRAGPRASQIERLQSGVDALIAAAAVAGPPGRQTTVATTHRQPTPGSIATAKAKLKEGARAERAKAAMARAQAADRADDTTACVRALADVQREIGP